MKVRRRWTDHLMMRGQKDAETPSPKMESKLHKQNDQSIDKVGLCDNCLESGKENGNLTPCGGGHQFCDHCGPDFMVGEKRELRCPLCHDPAAYCYRGI